ncbi:right-handed parallel beta-helix repeat-containing protein [Pelagicoccus enzymogenes]|uniref:right-handed parallel beta-helix repeat-containing protein n=1 Tax=Pelagicoccus enzymogenes TaxID=2773457 RepID=UPI00280C4933|nr:right-handed parallel beta-helix repeat-containing protein [Pelagicoccus enzymogenes]MDQ8199440.1 right-handed parallel beta-helix repeat-containing protein [Pelagicoccus enzymogenes]
MNILKNNRLFFGVFYVVVLMLCLRAEAAEYYVSKGGSDADDGLSMQKSWATLSYALSKSSPVSPGDVVTVLEGEYVEQVRFEKSGTPTAMIRVRTEGDVVFRDPDPAGGTVGVGHMEAVLHIQDQSNLIVEGFRIEGSWHFGIGLYHVENVIVQDCCTYNTGASGIYVGRWDHSVYRIFNRNVKILRCTIEKPGQHGKKWQGAQESLSVAATDTFEVAYCRVFDSPRDGIDIKNGSRNGSLHHCIVHDIEKIGIYFDAWKMSTYNIDVYNNLSYNNFVGYALIAEIDDGLLHDVRVRNNVALNNGYAGLAFTVWGMGSKHVVRDVLVEDNIFIGNLRGVVADNPDVESALVTGNIISSSITGDEFRFVPGAKVEQFDNFLIPFSMDVSQGN